MRSLCTMLVIAALSACATRRPPVAPALDAAARLADADALVRAGCFDCLVAAYREYDALRSIPAASAAASAGALRTAILIAIRERELGTEDSSYLARARELIDRSPAAQASTRLPAALPGATLVAVADSLPTRGISRMANDETELVRMQTAYRNRNAWTEQLRAHANDDELSAYLWLAFNCAYVPAAERALDEWMKPITSWRDTPLIGFKTATCGTYDRAALERLLEHDARFVEAHYYLGLAATFSGKLDASIEHLERAYQWRERWPSVTSALASDYIAYEEFDRAVEFFDRTLAVLPGYPDALLEKVKALTYGGHPREALAVVDELLAGGRWYVGDARYWRAVNEAQLGQNDQAWEDVELAAKLLVNAAVPKLAGTIAYRRGQLEVARAKFDESRSRDREDCETGYFLGVVLAEQAVWTRTADVLIETAACFQRAERTLVDEIDRIRGSDNPPAFRERQIARRQRQIAANRRMLATSWFDIAVAYYNLARKDDARQYAERVIEDEQFGERARELLTRLRDR